MTKTMKIGPSTYRATVDGRDYGPFYAESDTQAAAVAERMDRAMQNTVTEWDGD